MFFWKKEIKIQKNGTNIGFCLKKILGEKKIGGIWCFRLNLYKGVGKGEKYKKWLDRYQADHK